MKEKKKQDPEPMRRYYHSSDYILEAIEVHPKLFFVILLTYVVLVALSAVVLCPLAWIGGKLRRLVS